MKLTTEQIARIFAMYIHNGIFIPEINQPAVLEGSAYKKAYYSAISREYGLHYGECFFEECCLILKPLSAITDDDRKAVANMLHLLGDAADYFTFCKDHYDRLCVAAYETDHPIVVPTDVFQYLIQQGYAVPLFIALNHPDNGKTAIELGLTKNSNNHA